MKKPASPGPEEGVVLVGRAVGGLCRLCPNATDCAVASGTVTLLSWGDRPNEPFMIEVDVVLGRDPMEGAEGTLALILTANGSLVPL